MFKSAIGQSEDIDSEYAIQEILEQCGEGLQGQTAGAGILYASIDHEFDVLLEKINDAHPGIELIGCTTDGEVSSVLGFAEDSATLALFASDEVTIKAGVARGISGDLERAVSESVRETRAQSDGEPSLCILNPASLTASAAVVMDAFKRNLGETFPIFGGAAGDQWRFEKTHQFHKDEVLEDAAPYLLFSGPILFGSGVQSGWTPVGEAGRVTGVEHNVLHRIGKQTAVEFFKHYLSGDIGQLGEYPLAVYEDESSDTFYLRAVLLADEEAGSLTFAGDIPISAKVQLTHTTRERVIDASEKSVSQSIAEYGGEHPEVALCFSCAGRKQVLGTRTSEEYALLKKFNPDLKVFGFYGYGEIAPIRDNSPVQFHNETFVSLILGTR